MAKEQVELRQELDAAGRQIHEGEKWYHYKHPELTYTILGLGVIEATEIASVIYKSDYGEGIVWIRPVEEFLEKVEIEGNLVNRFNLVK
jgi:hypothetical protein